MSGPALALAGFAVAGSTARAGTLLACATVAAAVGGPLLGALLDRSRWPGRLLAGALVLYAAGLGAVLLGLGRLPFAVTALLAVAAGLTGPALAGGWTAQLPRLAPAGRMARLHGLDALTFSLAALAGPALAAVAALLLGAPAALVLAAALVAAAAPVAWTLPAAAPPPRGAAGAEGVGAVFRRGPLLRATLTSVGCATAQGMVAACLPALGARALGGSGRGALLLSVAAGAGLAATAAHARWGCAVPPGRLLWGGALAQAAAWAAVGGAAGGTGPAGGAVALGAAAVLGVAFAVAGAAEGPQLTALFAVRHAETPSRLRGRVFTTGASLKITGFAVGAAVAGPVAAGSLSAVPLLAAAVCAVSALPYAPRAGGAVTGVRGEPGRCRGRRSVRRRAGLPGWSGRP
ncbi:MFS transporter [Streptomyces sp. NPDC057854]|uniref:MFS transporter n=1 Tax=unclassified Streptomyces TaxID=2593676 RepID=UPI0036C6141C